MAGTKNYELPAFARLAGMSTEKKSTGAVKPVPSPYDDDMPAFSRFVSMNSTPVAPSPVSVVARNPANKDKTYAEFRRRTLREKKYGKDEDEEEKTVPEIKPYVAHRQQEETIIGLPEEPAYESPYAKNADYAEMSKYISTVKKDEDKTKLTLWERMMGNSSPVDRTRYTYEDPDYEYINRNEEAIRNREAADALTNSSFVGTDRSWLQKMSDGEIADYNYIYHTQGKEAAEKFINDLEKELTKRQMDAYKKQTEEYARDEKLASSVSSVLMGPMNALSLIGQIADYADDREIDPNAGSNKFTIGQKTIRETVPENWGKVGQFLYGTGMSVADNLYNMALTGAFGNVGGLGKGAETLVLGIMGSSAAANSTLEALENGYSSSRALLQGAIAGGIEALTEKISFETLLNPNAFADGSLKYILKNMLAEGSEEGMSTLLNWTVDVIGDQITGQRLNEWARTYDAIAAANPDLSEAEIKRKMVGTMAGQLALDVAGGMLSGGLLAGGSSAVNLASNTMMGRNMNQSMSPDQISEYVNDSYNEISNDAASTPYQENLNERAMRQLRNNGRVNNRTLGELAQNIDYTVADRQNAENLVDLALARINAGRSVNGSLMNEIMKNDRAQNYLRDYGGLKELEGSYAEKASAVNNALNQMLQTYDNNTESYRRAWNSAVDTANLVSDFADTFGEKGSRAFKNMAVSRGYEGVTDLAKSYAQVYNAVKEDPDVDLNKLSAETKTNLEPRELDTVFKAALQDRETDLKKTGLEYDNEKGETNGTEERTEGPGVVEERYAGVVKSVTARSLETRTAEIRERRESSRLRRESIQNNAAIRSLKEVTAKEADIPNGLDDQNSKIRVLPENMWSVLPQDDYSLLNDLKSQGFDVKAYIGQAKVFDSMSNTEASVRGFIDGKTIGVRMDSEMLPRKIAYHELFHDMVAKDSEMQAEMVNKLYEHYGEDRLRATIRDYVGQYGWTNASDEEILNEILADSYAGIDIYENLLAYEGATQYSENVRQMVREGREAGTIKGGAGALQFSRETTSVQFDESSHSQAEINEFNNYLNSADSGILNFTSTRTATGRTSRHDFGTAGKRQVAQLRDLTGIDFSGYENSINASALNHIENRHGGGSNSADATMKKPEDIARIGYVINNADYAEYIRDEDGEILRTYSAMDKNNQPGPIIRFVKKVDGNYVAVISVAENARKKLRVVTAFMAKTKEAITRVSNADLSALHLTADTAHPSLASNNNISQEQVSGQEEFIIDPEKTSEIDRKVENGESLTPSEESQFSLEHDEEFAKKAERYNVMKGSARYVSASVMRQAIAQRAFVRELLTRDGMAQYLPEDKMGKTSFGNASYGMSMEHSTICPRTLSMEAILDGVSENFGRPLTVDESVRVSQLAWEYMDAPECAYCYVAMDRKAKREYRLNYLQSRDEVFRNLDAGMSEEEAYETFLNGRKDTAPMKKRFNDWIRLRENGADMIQMKDLASERAIQAAMKRGSGVAVQIRDVEKYAQSASWAKKYVQYTAYNGEILKWTQDRINKLNAMYGLRMYSFSDFHPAFTLEDMQIVTDAAVRGLKVLAYTKEMDFARIMEPTGANINISVFAQTTRDQNGDFGMDAMQGADWNEARELRERSIKNGTGIGITMVCVNDEQIDWALDQDWIDVVIPFHMVKTGAKVADYFGWKNYTDMQGDRKLEDWTAGENERMIEPPVHQNDKDLYFKALEENHLSPRFAKWQDHENYMKLVNETRVREADTPVVQPVFNTDAVESMIDTMVKQGGYYQHAQYLGLDEDTFEGVTEDIADTYRERFGEPAQFSRETSESTFDELFSTLEDGRIKPNNVADLSTEDWRLIYKAVNKLGYGMESVKQTKEVYSRYVGESGFNKEQSEAIKQAYGITENNSVPINPKREALARKTFGITTDFREAGYLMRNGSMLDFSGKRDGGESGVRYMDHREIAEVFSDGEISDERTQYGNNTAYMDAFISEGNIRLMDGQGVTIGEMEPTSSQYTMLKRFIDHVLSDEDYFYLDLSNRDGYTVASRDYNSSDGSSRIVRDIKEYFKNGELPYKSDLQQFRFSRDTEETETEKYLKAQNRTLQNQLEDITKRYEHFKDQLTLTKVRTGTQKSAYRSAKNILSDYESGAEVKVLRDGLLKAAEAFFNASEDITADELQTNMKQILMPYAADVIYRSYGLMNEEDVKVQREIRNTLRNGSGIVVTDRMKSDIPNWNKFRQAQFGNMKLVSGTKTNVAEIYSDLREQFGANYFPADIVNESDMLQHVADVMADLAAIWDNPYTYGGKDAAEAVEACANDMIMELVSNIEEKPPTFADKENAKLEKARREAIEAKDKALSRVREQRDEALKKQAEHYQDRIKSMYDQRRMYELRSQIRKKVNDLGVKLIKPTDKQHVPQPLQGAVIDVLRQVNTGSTFDWARPYDGTHTEQGTGIPTRRTNAFIRLKDQLTELRDRLVVDQDLFDSEEGSGILSELALYPETSIDKLNVEQLDKVMIVLKSCENAIRTWNKMFNEGKYQEISEAAEAIYIENMDKKGRPEYARPIEMTKNLVSVDMLTPEAYFNRMGTSGRSLFKMLRKAQDQNIRILKEAQEYSKENGLYDLKLKDYEKKLVTVKFGSREVKMTKAQLMELYILNKRDASRAHIQVGGILPEPVTEGVSLKKVTYNEPVRNVTQEDIARAMENLTAEDIRIAEAMQRFVSTVMTDYGNEASMRVYGYNKFGEENYWPIKVNEQDLKTELGAVKVRARSVSTKGFTNAIKPNAKQSVMIGSIFDTFNEHVAEMANYSAWLPVMEDMKRIYNFTEKDQEGAIEVSTKYTIQKIFGQKGTTYFEKLMQDLSNGTVSEQSYFGGLVGRFKAAAVGSNLRVIIQQPTAIFRAMDMISPKYLAQGMLTFNRGAKRAIEKAPIAQWKDWGYFDINTGRSTKNILFENSTTLDRVQNVLMSGAGKADSVAWGALYSAVEAETKDLHPELDVRSNAFDDIVVERFEEIIDHSQVVDGVLQRSGIMRSENAIDKMATSFMGEPTKQFNMLTSAIYDYRNAKDATKSPAVKHLGRTVAAMLFAGVLNAAVQSIMDAVRNDDPEKDYWEKFLEKFTGEEQTFASFFSSNLGDLVNPLQYIPYAKDIVSIAQGYDVERMDVSLINDLYTDGKSMVNALQGKGKYSLTNNIMNFTNTVAKFFGLSVGNVKRDAAGLLNTFAQNTGNYMMMYRMAKFTYNLNQSTEKGRFVAILAEAYNNDREAYDLILRDLIKEDRFATSTMTTYEWIRKRLKEKHDIVIPKE